MSLINQMLKDLEARRQQQQPGVACTVAVASCQQPLVRRSSKLLWLVAGIVVFGLGCTGWWYLHFRQTAVQLVDQVSGHIAVDVSEQSPPAEADSEPDLPQNALLVKGAQEPVSPVEVITITPLTVETEKPLADTVTVKNLNGAGSVALLPQTALADAAAQPVPALVTVVPQAVAAVVISKPPTSIQQAQQLRLQAQRLMEQKNYAGAADLLQRALNIADGGAAQWHKLTIVYLQAGQLPAACRVADAGCQRYPNAPSLRVLQARLLLEMGKKEQALAALNFIAPPPIALASDYYALLATLQQQSGDLAGALNNYQLLTTAFPQRGDWWIGSAICAEQLGQRSQATIYYEQALRCPQLQAQLKQYALQQLQRLAKG